MTEFIEYMDVLTSKGETLRVYPVPENIIRGVIPNAKKPPRPKIEMKTKSGTQARWAKDGDPEFDVWKEETDEWKEMRDDLRDQTRLVIALRDFAYPDPIVLPPHIQLLVDMGNLLPPTDPLPQRAMYLQSTALERQIDESNVYFAIQQLSGVPEEVIDQMKADFRDILYGATSRKLGGGDSTDTEEDSDDAEV